MGVLVEAVQTVASCEHEQIHIDFAKRVLFDPRRDEDLCISLPLTKDMIDQEGCDENGDNLISEQEFESRTCWRPKAGLGIFVGETGSPHSSSASWGGPLRGSGVW